METTKTLDFKTNGNVLIEAIIARIEGMTDRADCGTYGADLHHYLFNEDFTLYYTADCIASTEQLSVWDCVGLVQAYEKFNFGEVTTDLADPFKVANMVAYIVGADILHESEYLSDQAWDSDNLTEKDLIAIRGECLEFVERCGDSEGLLMASLKNWGVY